MRAGRMRARCRFERRVLGDDGIGNVVTNNWIEIVAIRGEFRPERATEAESAGRPEARVAGKLMIRSADATRAITEADRVVINGVPFQIRGIIDPDQRRRRLEFSVERGVAF